MSEKKGPGVNHLGSRGRPKGSANKMNNEIREVILDFINYNIVKIQENFDLLSPKDKLTFLDKLIGRVLPPPLPDKDDDDSELKITINRK